MFKHSDKKPMIHKVSSVLLSVILLIPMVLLPFSNSAFAASVSVNEQLAATGAKNLIQTQQTLADLMATSAAATTSTNQITVNSNQDQDFFTPTGSTQIIPSVDSTTGKSTWSQIVLTNESKNLANLSGSQYSAGQYQAGGVTLNTRIDMSKPFHFSWQVKMSSTKTNANTPMADGIGFFLHPTYLKGETQNATTAEIDGYQPVSQDIQSLGWPGGNLGTSDLMNAWGFKLDTFFDNGVDSGQNYGKSYANKSMSGTYYGDKANHAPSAPNLFTGSSTSPDSYADPDDYIGGGWYNGTNGTVNLAFPGYLPQGGTTQWGPYGSFTATDKTGYMSYPNNSNNWFGLGTLGSVPLNGTNANAVNLLNNSYWETFTMDYDPAPKNILGWTVNPSVTVTIQSNSQESPSKKIQYIRNLADGEAGLIKTKKYYAFGIEGTTGYWTSTQAIQNITGSFTPESPTLIEWWATEDGSPLASSKTLSPTYNPNEMPTDGTVTAYANTTITSTTTPTQGFTGTLSHVLLTTYNNDKSQQVRVPASAIQNNNNQWAYTLQTNNMTTITIITFIYRQSNNLPQFSITYSPPGFPSWWHTNTVGAGQSVTATATITAPTSSEASGNSSDPPGPVVLPGVQIIDKLPGQFQLGSSTNNSVSMANNGTQLTINIGDLNAATPTTKATTVTITYTLTNLSANTINLTNSPDSAYLYDTSVGNIDENGNPVKSSYYYQATSTDAPFASAASKGQTLMSTYTNMDPGNYVPSSPNTPTPATINFHYWDDTTASATTMDPNKSGHPTTSISGYPDSSFSGLVGDSIGETPPIIPGYQYMGYYEYDGLSTGSTWHPAGSGNTAGTLITFYYTVPTIASPNQQVAFIYQPTSTGSLSLQAPNLNFGSYSQNMPASGNFSAKSTDKASLSVTDNRSRLNSGNWRLSVAAPTPFTSNGKSLTGATITFPQVSQANLTSNGTAITQLETGNSALAVGTSTVFPLASATGYGGATFDWPAGQLILKLPNQTVSTGRYQTTLNWILTSSL